MHSWSGFVRLIVYAREQFAMAVKEADRKGLKVTPYLFCAASDLYDDQLQRVIDELHKDKACTQSIKLLLRTEMKVKWIRWQLDACEDKELLHPSRRASIFPLPFFPSNHHEATRMAGHWGWEPFIVTMGQAHP